MRHRPDATDSDGDGVGDSVVVDTGELDQDTITAASITIAHPLSIGAARAQNLRVFAPDECRC